MIGFSPVNPLRFGFGDEYQFDHNLPYCYFQKWAQHDEIRVQILSDAAVRLVLRDLLSGEQIQVFEGVQIPSNLQNVAFFVWEFSISNLPTGLFFFDLKADNLVTVFKSNPFSVSEMPYRTVLFRYRNSFNTLGAIFETGIEFSFRAEGTVQLFTPKQDSTIYFDQIRNPVLLSATPFRSWSLIIGLGTGVPDWVLDLLNHILAVDTKQVDRLHFNQNEGAEMEVQRVDNYPLSSAKIEIVQRFPEDSDNFHYDLTILADTDNNAVKLNNSLVLQR